MKKYLLISLSAGMLFLASGCATKVTKQEAYPQMYEEKPTSILVAPAINQSTAADAPHLYFSTINEPLSSAGFYVLPMPITEYFLREEGLVDGAEIKQVAPQKFLEFFGADAVLYTTINQWDTNYIVVSGSVEVEIEFELVSCHTGESLWTTKRVLVVDTSVDAGHIVLNLVLTAASTAAQDYVPIARSVNWQALQSVPYGKYHPAHGTDRDVVVEFPPATLQEILSDDTNAGE